MANITQQVRSMTQTQTVHGHGSHNHQVSYPGGQSFTPMENREMSIRCTEVNQDSGGGEELQYTRKYFYLI